VSTQLLLLIPVFLAGAALWTLAEYLLHRFAMHEMGGKGMMSREHLEHHVESGWALAYTNVLSWIGVGLVGGLIWAPLGWLVGGLPAAAALALGWVVGYFFYEYQHSSAHLRAPRGRYTTWLRRHHFHHHFGHPMRNHGVTVPLWDMVFGTREEPTQVRVPRRLVLPWMVDDRGELLPRFRDHYVLVGAATSDERSAALDRARAFASLPPAA
jgi:sterol desaturase/sphingolipid hydroxylase (fatty acid hydroxylase superfamily)